ncbi:MAG: putative baseplate assembly protein [Ornithinimicrobium sp.]
MLPAPNLDDRRFQQLVDDAKRSVQQKCPEWTDHNVSDPGVTLIEAFAHMVDQVIYRLNRVPDRHYVKFLELIGVELRPPSAARGTVTFWLSAPQPQPVLVRTGTEVATARTDLHNPIVFSTLEDLQIVPTSFARSGMHPAGGTAVETTGGLDSGHGFTCFSDVPAVDDALLIGLSEAAPSCAVLLRLDCAVAGVGVDPRRPPLVWEAWNGTGWSACEIDRDETGGLNRPGDVVLHIPTSHAPSIIARQRAGWLRCRLVDAGPDRPTYTAAPLIRSVTASTIGGSAPMLHAQEVRGDPLGHSDGTPGQRMSLSRRPVVPSAGQTTLEVEVGSETQSWQEVPHFALSGPGDHHFRIAAHDGEVHFGPAVRQPDGSLRYYGAVPPKGANIVAGSYRTGGGRAGNVAVGQIRVLKTSVPYVARVENRAAAIGGSEPESLEDAKVRGPLLLRSRGRAVTAEDFEGLAREVAPDAARVQCVAADRPEDAGGIRLLVVPHVASDEVGRVRRTALDPPEATLARISERLDERRLVGTRLAVVPPEYVWLTAVVSLSARPREDRDAVQTDVLRALYRHFHPLIGGPHGNGWPFGRAVQAHEVNAALAGVQGVDMSQEVSVALFPAEADTGRRQAAVASVEIPATALIYSYEHQVRVRT